MASLCRSLSGRALRISRRLLASQTFNQPEFQVQNFNFHKVQRISKEFVGLQTVNFCTNAQNVEIAYYDEIKKISLEDKPKVLMVDVREPEELKETSQIRNSINIPLGQVEDAFSDKTSNKAFQNLYKHEKPDEDDPIIFLCKIGLGVVQESFKLEPNEFKTKFSVDKPKFDDPIIMICRRGIRAHDAAVDVKKLGYKDVKNYLGSYTDWAEREGLPPPP